MREVRKLLLTPDLGQPLLPLYMEAVITSLLHLIGPPLLEVWFPIEHIVEDKGTKRAVQCRFLEGIKAGLKFKRKIVLILSLERLAPVNRSLADIAHGVGLASGMCGSIWRNRHIHLQWWTKRERKFGVYTHTIYLRPALRYTQKRKSVLGSLMLDAGPILA